MSFLILGSRLQKVSKLPLPICTMQTFLLWIDCLEKHSRFSYQHTLQIVTNYMKLLVVCCKTFFGYCGRLCDASMRCS
jgi:hypothetical protein